mmetsp:Transcript_45022/g.97781  ORF Transcript_45022/g.97781 Transcript_45022/m.97781 type:complete len:86 (+) Transcript_45022:1302-1559(+)
MRHLASLGCQGATPRVTFTGHGPGIMERNGEGDPTRLRGVPACHTCNEFLGGPGGAWKQLGETLREMPGAEARRTVQGTAPPEGH